MKNKVIFTVISLLFAFAILAFSVVRASAQTESSGASDATTIANDDNQADELNEGEAEKMIDGAEPLTSPAQTDNQSVDYYLPYPGILPDHFLYPIKMIRDRIWLFLTTDEKDKGELYLLYADKRLGASKALIEGGKQDLGLTTLSKAEKYLEQALAKAETLKDKDFIEKVYKSSLKHEEVMLELKEKINSSNLESLNKNISYARRVQEKLLPLLGN